MPDRANLKRYLENWKSEKDGTSLYRTLARYEKDAKLAKVFDRLADVEGRHAALWEKKIIEAGGRVPRWRPGFRNRALCFFARRFGPSFVLPSINALEKADSSSYDDQPEARENFLPRDERSHARILELMTYHPGSGIAGEKVARLEGRHRAVGGNALRAAVLGANDGLVSNLSLIMGVAGAEMSPHTIVVTGLAGLLAGACSMAMGEWLSVQSSRELYQRQIAIEAAELEERPEEEMEELVLIYEAKGLPREQAVKMAEVLINDKEHALNTLSKEELGIDPEELGGSAWEAALTSFILFSAGAIIPLCPFFFLEDNAAVFTSLAAGAAGLFVIGSLITVFTGRGILFSGLRQLLFGLAAAAVTFGIGRLIGVQLS